MSGIDIYQLFSVDRNQSGAENARDIQRKIGSSEAHSWNENKKLIAPFAVKILADPLKKETYDRALQSPFAPPEVTEEFLKKLASSGAPGHSHMDAPRGPIASAAAPTGGHAIPGGVVQRTVTKTFAPVQPLAANATVKDAWARTPLTIRWAIGALVGLAIFILLHRGSLLIDNAEYLSDDWARLFSYIVQLLPGIFVIGAICLILFGGFSTPGLSRHLKISVLVILGSMRLFACTSVVTWIFEEYGWLQLSVVEIYPESWWTMAIYFGLFILALILCLLPQSMAWYRGMTVVKEVS